MSALENIEQPGRLYLGRELDGGKTGRVFLLPARELTTHAAIIGMTGSGKTGLGIALLEEIALAKIPAIVIDPKGDMANLLLSFPELSPAEFAPWIDADVAARRNLSVQDLAVETAGQWQKGLATWGQDGARIRRLRENADFAVFTPGTTAGRPVSVLDSMDAPDPDTVADRDTLSGLVNAAVSSLLSLVGIEADPIKSREHVLLATIVLHFWTKGEAPSLATLIAAVAQPPFAQVGVFPVDSFYPENRRMELAMRLNTLVASPAFQGWTTGEALNIQNLLGSGRPRVSIFSLAHLSDAERMFFVTLLLGRLIGWMRRQEGSSELRALLYMDEIFGYFPPNSNPPAKAAMLLLLKQARAFGLGVALATQNPVDLDYKGMANIGSWFVGRLQTRQDQERVLSGMGGEAAGNREQLRTLLAGLEKRCFLLCSAHRQAPLLFQTRWTLSYLKGPVTLAELAKLQAGATQRPAAVSASAADAAPGFSAERPLVAGGVTQYFVPSPVSGANQHYRATVLGLARVRHADARRGIDQTTTVQLQAPMPAAGAAVSWEQARPFAVAPELLTTSAPAALFGALPADMSLQKTFDAEKKRLAEHLYRSGALPLFTVRALNLESAPGENEAAFRERLGAALAAKKDEAMAALRASYDKKQQQLQTKLQKAEAKLDKEKIDVRTRGLDTVIAVGSAIVGAFLGRKGSALGKSTQGMRSAGHLLKERQDVQAAQDEVSRIAAELAALQAEAQGKMQELLASLDPAAAALESISVAPRKSDIFDVRVCLLWEPVLDFADPPKPA